MSLLTPQHLFGTPLISADLAHAEALGHALLRSLASRSVVESSTRAAWTSDSKMLRWGGEAAVALLEQCVALADQLTVDIDAEPGKTRYGWWADLRAQTGGEAGVIEQSCYPGAYWSFLVGLNEAAPTGTQLGKLQLEDPRMPMLHMEDASLRPRVAPEGKPLCGYEIVSLVPADLVMFPAWLRRRLVFDQAYVQSVLLTLNLTAVLGAST